jgi:hypothetical protein
MHEKIHEKVKPRRRRKNVTQQASQVSCCLTKTKEKT